MGLDFGIDVKAKTFRGMKYLANNFDNLEKDYVDPTKYEFTYWRNNYRIREKTLNALSYKDYDGMGGYIDLTTVEDLVNVAEVFQYFLNEKNWDEYNSWHYCVIAIAEAVHNIRKLIDDIEAEEIEIADLRIELYDSY